MGIKALLRRYAFSAFVIICVTVLLCGIIFVRERTQYNMDMTEYDTVGVSREGDSIIFTAGRRRLILGIPDYGLN